MIVRLMLKTLPLNVLEKIYLGLGACVSEVSDIAGIVGEPVGFKRMEKRFKELEQEYAKRGFRPIPQDSFVSYRDYGIPIQPSLIRQRA